MPLHQVDVKSIQNDADGMQLRRAFAEINAHFGSQVVDISTIVNTQSKYSERKATGLQLRRAFTAINVAFGSEVVDVSSIQNVCNGHQLKNAFTAINEAMEVANTVGPNLYPNYELVNGSDIIQDVPTGSLPDGHVLAFETSFPVDADYIDEGDGSFHYRLNTLQEVGRLSLQQTISGFEVGKVYRFQVKVKTTTSAPTGTVVRALHIAALVDMNLVEIWDSFIIENSDFVLRWIDFEVTASNGRGNFRHGAGVFDPVATMQETKDIAIYELELNNG